MRFSRRLLLLFLLFTPIAAPEVEVWPAAAKLDAYFDALQIREIGYFLRFQPRSDELVVRGPEWAYYLRREE